MFLVWMFIGLDECFFVFRDFFFHVVIFFPNPSCFLLPFLTYFLAVLLASSASPRWGEVIAFSFLGGVSTGCLMFRGWIMDKALVFWSFKAVPCVTIGIFSLFVQKRDGCMGFACCR